jgi:hypothetical protein
MSLKNAAFLAAVGTVLLALLVAVDLIRDVLAVVQGLIPPMRLLRDLIYAFAAVSVAVFFYVFHKAQS